FGGGHVAPVLLVFLPGQQQAVQAIFAHVGNLGSNSVWLGKPEESADQDRGCFSPLRAVAALYRRGNAIGGDCDDTISGPSGSAPIFPARGPCGRRFHENVPRPGASTCHERPGSSRRFRSGAARSGDRVGSSGRRKKAPPSWQNGGAYLCSVTPPKRDANMI